MTTEQIAAYIEQHFWTLTEVRLTLAESVHLRAHMEDKRDKLNPGWTPPWIIPLHAPRVVIVAEPPTPLDRWVHRNPATTE